MWFSRRDERAPAREHMLPTGNVNLIITLHESPIEWAHGSGSEELARQLLIFNRRIPPEEIIAKIDAVDIAAIRRVGRRLLTGGGPTLAAIGPLGRLPSLDAIRGYLAS
jgi:hypothetical protein